MNSDTARQASPEYARAEAIWKDYQRRTDVVWDRGKVAVIEPLGGAVWVGATAEAALKKVARIGVSTTVFLVDLEPDARVKPQPYYVSSPLRQSCLAYAARKALVAAIAIACFNGVIIPFASMGRDQPIRWEEAARA